MTSNLTGLNTCPICGKKRGGKINTHGACAEKLAKREKEEFIIKKINDRDHKIKVVSKKRAKHNEVSKQYIAGRLPDWMYS